MTEQSLVLVQIENNSYFTNKTYLFETRSYITEDCKYATVNTERGVQFGRIVGFVSKYHRNEDVDNALMKATGATLPLKKVISLYREEICDNE